MKTNDYLIFPSFTVGFVGTARERRRLRIPTCMELKLPINPASRYFYDLAIFNRETIIK